MTTENTNSVSEPNKGRKRSEVLEDVVTPDAMEDIITDTVERTAKAVKAEYAASLPDMAAQMVKMGTPYLTTAIMEHIAANPKEFHKSLKENKTLQENYGKVAAAVSDLNAHDHCLAYQGVDWVLRKDIIGDVVVVAAAAGIGYSVYKFGEFIYENVIAV
jgi:hypothetical protein